MIPRTLYNNNQSQNIKNKSCIGHSWIFHDRYFLSIVLFNFNFQNLISNKHVTSCQRTWKDIRWLILLNQMKWIIKFVPRNVSVIQCVDHTVTIHSLFIVSYIGLMEISLIINPLLIWIITFIIFNLGYEF